MRNLKSVKVLFFICLSMLGATVSAHMSESISAADQAIMVEKPFSRATNGPNGAVFLRLVNKTNTPLHLVKAESETADAVELHEHIQDGDVFRMRAVERISIAAGDTTVLKPGGLHVMLLGLKKPLVEGDTIALTLHFGQAEPVTVTVPVKAPGYKGCGCCHHKNKMKKSQAEKA